MRDSQVQILPNICCFDFTELQYFTYSTSFKVDAFICSFTLFSPCFFTPKGRGSTLLHRIVEAIVDSPRVEKVNQREGIPLIKSDTRRAMYVKPVGCTVLEIDWTVTVLACLCRISAWCDPAIFQSSEHALSFSTFSMLKDGFHPIRSILSIQFSDKKKKLQKKIIQTTPANQEIQPDGPLGEILKEKEEWIFIMERFAALEWKMLLLG
jgi:hypothetical protein